MAKISIKHSCVANCQLIVYFLNFFGDSENRKSRDQGSSVNLMVSTVNIRCQSPKYENGF